MEVLGEFARMRLADRSLTVEHVGNNAARSEYGNQIALPNAAILHENTESGQNVRDIATVRANGGIASPGRIESFGGRRPPAALAKNCHSLP